MPPGQPTHWCPARPPTVPAGGRPRSPRALQTTPSPPAVCCDDLGPAPAPATGRTAAAAVPTVPTVASLAQIRRRNPPGHAGAAAWIAPLGSMLAPSNRRGLAALTRAPGRAVVSRVREGYDRAHLGQDARGSDGLRMGGFCRGSYLSVTKFLGLNRQRLGCTLVCRRFPSSAARIPLPARLGGCPSGLGWGPRPEELGIGGLLRLFRNLDAGD